MGPNKKSRSGNRDDYNDWSRSQKKPFPERDRTRSRVEDRNMSRNNYKKKDMSQKRPKKNDSMGLMPQASQFDALMMDDDEDIIEKPTSTRSRRSERHSMTSNRQSQSQRESERRSAPQLDKPIRACSLGDYESPDRKKVEKSVKNLFDELYMSHDLDNAVMCVDDIERKEFLYIVISSGIKTCAESRASKAIQLTADLFSNIGKSHMITPSIATRGILLLLEDIRDLQWMLLKFMKWQVKSYLILWLADWFL